MHLPGFSVDSSLNLLPKEGQAYYYGKILSAGEAEFFFTKLFDTIIWERDEVIVFGKRVFARRKVSWHADAPLPYTYSGVTKVAKPWTQDLLILKNKVESIVGQTFNACLLNLYKDGTEGMGWHSDNEKELKKDGIIASLSLGAQRRFLFKHKRGGEKIALMLENGSLLTIEGSTQTCWLHSVPIARGIADSRINLTFRVMV